MFVLSMNVFSGPYEVPALQVWGIGVENRSALLWCRGMNVPCKLFPILQYFTKVVK